MLRDNPEARIQSIKQSAIDLLRVENTRLLKSYGTGENVPKESFERILGENENLRVQVCEKDKRVDRLKMVFGEKIAEFREVCFSC